MDTYFLIYLGAVLGLARTKRTASEGFIRYATAQRHVDKARTFSTINKSSLKCAVMCSRMAKCDYYMFKPKAMSCMHHQNRKQVFVQKPISSIYWSVDCGKPPRANHGKYTVRNKVAHYTCNKMFKLFGTNDIRCSKFWPSGPKCLRYIWKNPILKSDFNAKIPWGFKEGGSINLSGRPTRRDQSFVLFIGSKKTSKQIQEDEKFLLHMEIKVSTSHKQEITLHAGSMASQALTWAPAFPLYSRHNITELTINFGGDGLKIAINGLPFKNNAKVPNMIQYEDIKIISLFNNFKVELLTMDTK